MLLCVQLAAQPPHVVSGSPSCLLGCPRLDKKPNGAPTLSRVYDSGSLLESISAAELPALFNSEGTTDSKDKRSDNKGPEPEGVVSAGEGGNFSA